MGNAARSSTAVQIYNTIKDRVIDCEYAPGTLLNEQQLAEELGTSRTPIRDAINKLEMEGLVQVLPKKGIYVTDISFNDVLQVFQTRIEVEPIALRLAAPRLDKDLLMDFYNKYEAPVIDITKGFRLDTAMHLYIIENCGNRFIIDMMHRVYEQNMRIIISSKQNQIQIHDAAHEHLEILQLLMDQQYESAEEKMRIHIQNCRQAALDFFCNGQVFFPLQNSLYKREMEKIES